jgi:copper transport protein
MFGIRDAKSLLAIAGLLLVVVAAGIIGWSRLGPSGVGDDFFVHLHSEKVMANVTAFPGRAGPVAITIQLATPDERPFAATSVSVSLSKPDAGIAPEMVQAQLTRDGRWRATMIAPVPGRWMLTLGIRVPDSENISVEAPILIK